MEYGVRNERRNKGRTQGRLKGSKENNTEIIIHNMGQEKRRYEKKKKIVSRF